MNKKEKLTNDARVILNADSVHIITPGSKKGKKTTAKPTEIAHPSVLWTLFQCYKGTLIPAAIMKTAYDALQFVGPQLLKLLISFIGDRDQPLWRGIFYAGLMFVTAFIQSMLLHQYFHRMFRCGMNIKSVLTAAIFEKSLSLSNASRKNRTVGEIVNLMAVDVQRFQDITTFGMLFISAPFQVALD